MWKAFPVLLLLGGCTLTDREAVLDIYSRGDIDAINATAACKAAARTLVQIARCDVRR